MIKRLVIQLLFILGTGALTCAQNAKPFFRNYSDIDVFNPVWISYHLFQDSAGFIWSSGPSGLMKFDGEKSKSHSLLSQGISEMGHIKGVEDSKGRLWFVSLNGMLSYYENGSFQVFDGNDSIKHLLARNKCVTLCVDKNDVLHLGTHSRGYFKYLPGKGLVPVVTAKSHAPGLYAGKVAGQPFVFSLLDVADTLTPVPILKFQMAKNGLEVTEIGAMPTSTDFLKQQGSLDVRFIRRANKDMLVSAKNYLFELKEDTVLTYKTPVQMTSILEDGYGSLWLSNANEKGVYYIANGSLESGERQKFLPNAHVHSLAMDRNMGVWFGTRKSGLYHAAYPFVDVYEFSAPFSDVSVIFELDSPLFFTSTQIGVFHAFDGNQLYSFKLNEATDFLRSLFYDQEAKKLLLGCDRSIFILEESGFRKLQHPDFDFVKQAHHFKQKDKTIWVSGRRKLLKLESEKVVYETPTLSEMIRDFCFFQDTLYVGSELGVWKLNGEEWVDMSDSHPEFAGRCEHLRVFDNALWVFNFQKGCFIYKKGRVEELKDRLGYDIRAVGNTLLIGNSMITTSTADCITKISPNASDSGYTISVVPGAHSYHRVMVSEMGIVNGKIAFSSYGELYVYNPERLQVVPDIDLLIEGVSVNGKAYAEKEAYVLRHDSNNLSISFSALNFHGRGLWHYNYRIQSDQLWTQTEEGKAGFNLLPPGEYNFEVLAVNHHHQKSPILVVPITILPPFYQTWWFKLSIVLILVLLVWGWFRWRLGQVRKRGALLEKLHSSQHQALAARMNPHFIFNCLSAIHQFTLENNKEEAAEYMSEYAQLMRLVMENAGRMLVDVHSELEAIHIYLELERLRSQNRIEYEVEMESGFDASEAFVPALLIWPYLENAVWHGLMPKKEGKALLILRFKNRGKGIRIEIEDSGIGRLDAASIGTGNHPGFESVGMSITESRVELIRKIYRVKIDTKTFDLKDENGNATGTLVVLDIPPFP